ncbi:hypothetical protein [Mycoplasma todarodis]|uniref:Uncharacterized protein n=1 Tax=Mycoplasma todarodis TaxID=1937191 RepID=A0A4R0XUE7_9MOLU|nr:hypothetical protein [Mycoplasma todarodis]TCG11309.1 hypothetical protein C4B25_01850 [Mycoplasma todarodis]
MRFNKPGSGLKNDLEQDRKYDSYLDEYRRIINVGYTIVIKAQEKSDEVWKYTLNLFLSAFKPKLEIHNLAKGVKFKHGKSMINVLEFDEENIVSLELVSSKGTIKRISLNKNSPTFLKKYAAFDYEIFYKAGKTQYGLNDAMQRRALMAKEKRIAANLAIKVSKHFKVEPQHWATKVMNKKYG